MKKFMSLASLTLLLVGAVYFIAGAEEEPTQVHISQIDPDIIEAVSDIDCVCARKFSYWADYENMQPDKDGLVFVDSDGYPICLPCENEHQEEDPGN